MLNERRGRRDRGGANAFLLGALGGLGVHVTKHLNAKAAKSAKKK